MDIEQWVSQNEVAIRLTFFFGVFALMAGWEIVAPRRVLSVSKTMRWANNLGLVFLNSIVLRLIFPAAAVGVAAYANAANWGLLNIYEIPFVLAVIISVIAMDFVIYLQHVLVHAIPVLWRLHRVHHADPDYDVTTGSRFHPIEIIFSMLVKFATIVVIGPPVVAVVIFEIVLNAMAMFNHGNVGLPPKLDKILRKVLVTPDVHRVHHSVEDDEANSNFGFSLSIWDRMFGTFREQPRAGHVNMKIGIHKFHEAKEVTWLSGILTLPFKGEVSDYTINRRQWSDKE